MTRFLSMSKREAQPTVARLSHGGPAETLSSAAHPCGARDAHPLDRGESCEPIDRNGARRGGTERRLQKFDQDPQQAIRSSACLFPCLRFHRAVRPARTCLPVPAACPPPCSAPPPACCGRWPSRHGPGMSACAADRTISVTSLTTWASPRNSKTTSPGWATTSIRASPGRISSGLAMFGKVRSSSMASSIRKMRAMPCASAQRASWCRITGDANWTAPCRRRARCR